MGMVGDLPTRFSLSAGLSPPRISFCEADVKSARPAMGRYSWLRLGSLRSMSSACVTPRSASCRAQLLGRNELLEL